MDRKRRLKLIDLIFEAIENYDLDIDFNMEESFKKIEKEGFTMIEIYNEHVSLKKWYNNWSKGQKIGR